MTTRERVHQLVDSLPEDDLETIERYLDRLHETATDPVQRAFLHAAVLPPEALSHADQVAIEEAMEERDEVSHDEARRLLLNDR